MQDLTKKIDQILRTQFPDHTKEELDVMIQEYGQIAILESLNKILSLISSEEKKHELGNLIAEGKMDEAFKLAESEGVHMEEIFEEVSRSIVVDLFK